MSRDPLDASVEAETEADLPEIDPRYLRLAAGELPAEEAQALSSSTDDLDAFLAAAMAPLDEHVHERLVALAALDAPRRGPSSRGATMWAAGAGAAALAVVLFATRPAPPDYEAQWGSGVTVEVRTSPDLPPPDPPRFAPGATLDLTLVPLTRSRAPSVAVSLDQGAPSLDLDSEVTETGGVRLTGALPAIPDGPHVLIVTIGVGGVWDPLVPRQRIEVPFVVEAR